MSRSSAKNWGVTVYPVDQHLLRDGTGTTAQGSSSLETRPTGSHGTATTANQADLWRPVLRAPLTFLAGQQEICPETGRMHWQLFAQCGTKRISRRQVQHALEAPRCHCRPMYQHSSPQALWDYATKSRSRIPNGSSVEEGSFQSTASGTRTDYESAVMIASTGATDLELLTTLPAMLYLQYGRRLGQIRDMVREANAPSWRGMPVVWVYWGQTGMGKSRKVREMAPGVYSVPIPSGDRMWFPNYRHEPDILFDDFTGGACKLRILLQILDGYKLQVEYKGGHQVAGWNRVFITCNEDPRKSWYNKLRYEKGDEVLDPLWRRINESGGGIVHFDGIR